jgi:uncharacterized membrane protein YadS
MTEVKRKVIFKTEEWQPVVIGGLIIVLVIAGIRLALPGYRWMSAPAYASELAASVPAMDRLASQAGGAGETRLSEALQRLKQAAVSADRQAAAMEATAVVQAAKNTADATLARQAGDLGKKLSDDAKASFPQLFSGDNLLRAAVIGAAFLLLSLFVVWLGGGKILAFLAGFPLIYLMSWASQIIAGNVGITYWGLEYVVFALAIGLFISNVVGVPAWLREAVRTELYIKIGLVILGASILFPDILQAGALGVIQALLVVVVVWYGCFWTSRKLKVDDEFAVILSSAVSICGVSAAIAACGAIQGDKKKLSYVISLTLVVAIPMMVLMPWVARALKLPEALAGAWMGGTLDTTGSVVAASSLVGDTAMKVGTIVKFSQNVFIGVAAFALSLWWTFRKRVNGEAQAGASKPKAAVIWERFPKFVLGFLAASLVFSFILSPDLVKQTKTALTGLRTAWFGLAFVSIGLETKLSGFLRMGNGRPALAFIGAQLFNILWTLAIGYVLFSGNIFPAPIFKP